MIELKTTEWLLINWGKWAKDNNGLGYPSIEPYERMRASQSAGPQITDDEAMVIDRAVAELIAAKPREGDALARYYLYRPTYRELGRQLRKHHAVVAQWVDSGRSWVDGWIVGQIE